MAVTVMKKIDPGALAFDFDGVIADTMRLFLDIAHDEYRVNTLKYEDITCYSLVDCLDLEEHVIDGVITRILDGGYKVPLKPVEGAPEVLERIAIHHNPILFVTARPYFGPIFEWILNTLPLTTDTVEVVATGTYEGKAEVLLNKGISFFVEDRLETCFSLVQEGITPVLFKQPWNRRTHPFTEVNSWKELEAIIDFT